MKSASLTKDWIAYGLAGFLLGICLISFMMLGLFLAYQPAVSLPTPSTPTLIPQPTPTLVPQPTATLTHSDLLNLAQEALLDLDPQTALDLLRPHLDEFTDLDELALALEYLGQAENDLGHFQLAAAYLERLCGISPTARHYLMLARAYDSAGFLDLALVNYLIVVSMDDPELPESLYQMARERIAAIQTILTYSTSTATPPP